MSIRSANNSDSEETRIGDSPRDSALEVAASLDPFVPFTEIEEHSGRIITVRAAAVGILCGVLVNASNIYIGLRAGWTTSANVLGAIVSFAVLKRSSSTFGPHENNIAQTLATASGGMSNVFISGIPALYQLNLLTTPAKDFFRLVILATMGGYFGLLSIAPLRKFFINTASRELNLVFPSSFATAATIRSMHSAAGGEKLAQRKMKWTIVAFFAAMALRIASMFLPNNWHVFDWIAQARLSTAITKFAFVAESWGWVIEWSPAMIGSGFLVDFNVSSSFFAGAIFAWGFLGPYLVSIGSAFGEPSDSANPPRRISYTAMSTKFSSSDHPSPRYWLLWPGVACTLAVAFLELLCQSKTIWKFLLTLTKKMSQSLINLVQTPQPRYEPIEQETPVISEKRQDLKELTLQMWLPGLVCVVLSAIVILRIQFKMPVFEAVVALAMSFCLMLVAIQATGATDTTPINAITKVSQVALGSITRSTGATVEAAQRLNLVGASLTNIGACQGCDLMGDFRVGFLLGTPVHLQYIAQLIGTLVASLVAPAIFLLFTTAYPCIISGDASSCDFPAPTVASWRAVAVVASTPNPSIPSSSIYFSISIAIFSGVLVIAKHVLCNNGYGWIKTVWPNMMIFGLAFTLPNAQTPTTMMIGSLIAAFWKSRNAKGFEVYAFGVAAGLVAGEGIGGTINCALSILGLI
ncbi:Putative Oligopeptide transporter [[Torrubiella] hemipterigena]|uniref:Putative Oligopeptide transporter n=1 Tax=[Torrubiella] hemipterigena TaxID=1531966 RepID=A0A0A1TDK2_9HYPO|nr:Putative Oligopeptide transporter [[Torrubiella] hemipterigena]